VKDVVKAVIKLSENTTAIGQVFNIGGKDEISITNLANQIVGQLNSKSKISYVNYNDAYNEGFEEMFRRVPNITKIKNFIGWEPKIGINQVIDDVADDLIKEI
jgi:UDP-glucose 4-epimerase